MELLPSRQYCMQNCFFIHFYKQIYCKNWTAISKLWAAKTVSQKIIGIIWVTHTPVQVWPKRGQRAINGPPMLTNKTSPVEGLVNCKKIISGLIVTKICYNWKQIGVRVFRRVCGWLKGRCWQIPQLLDWLMIPRNLMFPQPSELG